MFFKGGSPGAFLAMSAGIFLLGSAIYVAASAGRIDIIDGQYRFDVAHNLIDDGSVQIRDTFLAGAVPGLIGAYSSYGISGSLVPIPLILAARIGHPDALDREQFFFSFASSVLGAATLALLFLFYIELGVAWRSALAWTAVAGFATLMFPASATVFDQAQHGFFLLAACFLAWLGGRRDSMRITIAGGLALAFLVNYQESYAVMFPGVGLAALGPGWSTPAERRRAFERATVFLFVGCMGLLFWAGYNQFRYGAFLYSGKGHNHPSPIGNPLIGFSSLLASPGKSIFLYSPPTIIALLGLRNLNKEHRFLGLSVVATAVLHLALISSLSFFGGDWCWGPRYFVTTLPLLSLAFPFATAARGMRKWAFRSIVAAGVCVQLLALSVEHHRFFYDRSLPAFFWYAKPTYYFTHSALFARPGELRQILREGVPPEATTFRPGPYSSRLTYAVFGGWGSPPPKLNEQSEWMRHYSVFWLPRPWPFWMRSIPPAERPVDLSAAMWVVVAIGAAGVLLIGWTARRPVLVRRPELVN
jgi:hypothetical protein